MSPTRVVLVPGVLALLPAYAGLVDPVAELRAACLAAVSWLGADVRVLADPQGDRVAAHLLAETETTRAPGPASYLLVGNGSACRSEKAPGHLDERSVDHDRDLEAWLRGSGPLPPVDLSVALLASTDGLRQADGLLALGEPQVDFEGDPFGVQYWVMRWELS